MMIEAQDLRKHFGSVAAVNGLSFQAPDGAITGLVGANAAGKTTTLRMLCGALKPGSGRVLVDGLPAAAHRDGLPRRVGGLLDHAGLYPRLTARENLAYFGRLHGIPQDQVNRRADRLIGFLGLDAVAGRPAAGYSQGDRMKTALGRALMHQPRNLLLDEPTNGLDVPSVRALRNLLKEMRDSGMCIVFSSHVLEEVRALCDQVVIISKGVTVTQGSPQEICRQAGAGSLEDAFVSLTGTTAEEVVC